MQAGSMANPNRYRSVNHKPVGTGPIVYWMSRDQRVEDNWALWHAVELANTQQQPVVVVFFLAPNFLGATARSYQFMLHGLREVEHELAKRRIPFFIERGDAGSALPAFAAQRKAGAVITDFSPLKIKRQWLAATADQLTCALIEVDAHNIVPCWFASPKQEYGAYTLRPKIHRVLPEFLTELPKLPPLQQHWQGAVPPIDWAQLTQAVAGGAEQHGGSIRPAGSQAARAALRDFLASRLQDYSTQRNDPTRAGQSELSPYLHFGQLSAQRVALEVEKSHAPEGDAEAFLEELIVRRELSDNYCYYNPHYDSFAGFANWAQQTLEAHWHDERPFRYTLEQLDDVQTHDPLWNAAQQQLRITGKMHGYLRMYWAKKILEWTSDPAEAQQSAIWLNDTYSLDGRDPNGYTGIAWSIGGVHDRPWFERPIFGKIRFMSYNGCKSKFNVEEYISQINAISSVKA